MIETCKITDLLTNPYNRDIDPVKVSHIKDEIQRTGEVYPIVYSEIDHNGKSGKMITDGHHRFFALKELGHTEVPVVMQDERGLKTKAPKAEIEVKEETQKSIASDALGMAAGALLAEGTIRGISHFLKPKKPKVPKIPASSSSSDTYIAPVTTKSEDTVDLAKAVKLLAVKPIVAALFNRKLLSRNAFKRTLSHGGHTVSLAGKSPKTGFAFSPYKSQEVIMPKAKFSPKHVDHYIRGNKDLLSQPNHHLGTWHNKETGNIHLDTSIVHPDQDTALREAGRHGQLAIHDLKTHQDIPVPKHLRVTQKDAASSAVKPREKGKTFLKTSDSRDSASHGHLGRTVRDVVIGSAVFHPKVQRVLGFGIKTLGGLALKHPKLVGTLASMGALALSMDTVDLEKLTDVEADSIGQELAKILMIDSTDVLEKVVRREGSKWVLYSRDGSRKLGESDSKEGIQERERQVQYFKTHKTLSADDLVKFITETFGKVTFERDDVREFSSDKIKATGDRLGVNWDKIPMDQLIQGTKVELEHLDVTGGDLEATVKIALAHIEELPDYYTRLKQMESDGDKMEPTEKGMIQCSNCLHKFDDLKLTEVKMGYVECPKCSYLVNQKGHAFKNETEKRIGSMIRAGIKALKPVMPKVEHVAMPPHIMEGALKELDDKYQRILREASKVRMRKDTDNQDIAKQVTHMNPTPEFAQANNGVDQEKINNINTELLNMYQVLQNIEARSKEEGILTEDELKAIVIPLKEELQRMMEALTPSDYEDTQEEPVKEPEPGPERQVGTAERELTNPATNFADKSMPKNDLEKAWVGIGGTGEGRGFHGDPQRHAEIARERWQQAGVPPGGRPKPKAPERSTATENLLVIPKAVREVATQTARKAGSSLSRHAGEAVGELGWQIFGTVAAIILYRYLGGESMKIGALLASGKQGLKTAIRSSLEFRRIRDLVRVAKLTKLEEWAKAAKIVVP